MRPAGKWGVHAFTVLFLGFLLIFSAYNVWYGRKAIADELKTFDLQNFREDMKELNSAIEENVAGGHNWMEAYGIIQLALGKHEENAFEVIKDKDGFL